MPRLALSTALACLLAAGCGDSDAGGDVDAARADAAPVADARPLPDAPSQADAAAAPNAVIHHLGDSLRIAVAEKFQPDNPCYPEPDVASVILVLPVAEASAGQTVDLSDGGSAHVCPPEDSGQNCQNFDSGLVTFDSYDADVRAEGSFDLEGENDGRFDAAWCE